MITLKCPLFVGGVSVAMLGCGSVAGLVVFALMSVTSFSRDRTVADSACSDTAISSAQVLLNIYLREMVLIGDR